MTITISARGTKAAHTGAEESVKLRQVLSQRSRWLT